MKKSLIIIMVICSLLIIFKYSYSNYTLKYEIDNYDIKTIYKNNRFYYEISDNNYTFNFEIYEKRSFKKDLIKKIININDENINCIYPVINNFKTYPLCYENRFYTDYNLIDSELLLDYKKDNSYEVEKNDKDFIFRNNLNDNEYVALWNYKGYIVMNGKTYKNIELFKNDKYDNSLAYIINDTIYMANNDEEHEYTKIIKLNLKTLAKSEIDLKHNIDFDSYIVGNVNNKLYLFDNKYSILYEIDTKKNKTEIVGSNEIGFIKYQDGEFISCSKSEYKINKIKFNKNYNDIYSNDGMYKSLKEKEDLKLKISNDVINIIKDNNDVIYYQYKDNFYKYDPYNGSNLIFYNYELTFNSTNTIFVYIK